FLSSHGAPATVIYPLSLHDALPISRIMVIGVGGAGGNAVNNMIRAKLEGVEFIIANTDAQAVAQSLVEGARRIQLGLQVTQGLGDRKSTRLNSSHVKISYAVFCLKK